MLQQKLLLIRSERLTIIEEKPEVGKERLEKDHRFFVWKLLLLCTLLTQIFSLCPHHDLNLVRSDGGAERFAVRLIPEDA